MLPLRSLVERLSTWGDVDLIRLAQDGDKWGAVSNAVMNLLVA
jgi:hypothetical protein